MKTHKSVLSAAVAASMLLAAAGCADQPKDTAVLQETRDENQNLNMLFITTDQERYFSEFPEGTNYKARQLLMEMGTTFEKHYICSNVSTSSRSVIYTGTHVTDTRMIDNANYIWQPSMSPDLRTVGDMMREAGYYTALKGKWHLTNYDFSDYDGPPLQMQDDLEQYGFSDWNTMGDAWGQVQEGYTVDSEITGDTISWLRGTGTNRNADGQPFFLAVNLVNPHDIMYYNPSAEQGSTGSGSFESARAPDNKIYKATYKTSVPSSWNETPTATGRVNAHGEFRASWSNIMGVDIKTEGEWKSFQDYYFNCIQDSDNSLMAILDELDNLNMLDNTIIVFTSDHGDMQGAHNLWGKGGFMYEYNIHVPMIIYHPDYKGGKKVSSVTSHLDLATTFVDMTNLPEQRKAEITKDLSGQSLFDLMDGSAGMIREAALFAYEMPSLNGREFGFILSDTGERTGFNIDGEKRGAVRGVITGQYKFARYFSPLHFNTPETLDDLYAHNDVELFDLKNDPDEMVNLAADWEKNSALITEMNTLLNRMIEKEIGADDGAAVGAAYAIIQNKLGQ